MDHLISRELTEPMQQANQANSQKSTGPRTEKGKLNSRWNSWRHGIFGNELCPWAEELDEAPADYQRFHHRFLEAFQVRDDVERLLAADMARTQWRLERVLHAETPPWLGGAPSSKTSCAGSWPARAWASVLPSSRSSPSRPAMAPCRNLQVNMN